MVIGIDNKSSKQRIITCLIDEKLKTYKIDVNENIKFDVNEPLAEIECDGTVILIPTIDEAVNYSLIDDQDIYLARKQSDIIYITCLILMCALTVLFLKTTIILIVLFLIIQALIITGIYKILKSEQKGEVVFLEY